VLIYNGLQQGLAEWGGVKNGVRGLLLWFREHGKVHVEVIVASFFWFFDPAEVEVFVFFVFSVFIYFGVFECDGKEHVMISKRDDAP
jgi:hypothetical protein